MSTSEPSVETTRPSLPALHRADSAGGRQGSSPPSNAIRPRRWRSAPVAPGTSSATSRRSVHRRRLSARARRPVRSRRDRRGPCGRGSAAATEYEVGLRCGPGGFLTGFGVTRSRAARRAPRPGAAGHVRRHSLVALVAAKYGIIAYVAVKVARQSGTEIRLFRFPAVGVLRTASPRELSPSTRCSCSWRWHGGVKVAAPSA